MDKPSFDVIAGNEREWRLYLIEKLEGLNGRHTDTAHKVAKIEVWQDIFKVGVSALFGLLLVYIEYRLK